MADLTRAWKIWFLFKSVLSRIFSIYISTHPELSDFFLKVWTSLIRLMLEMKFRYRFCLSVACSDSDCESWDEIRLHIVSHPVWNEPLSTVPYSVQSCFHIMDVCHSRTSTFDAVNRNKAPPPLMKPVTLPSGPNIAVFNKIPSMHSQVLEMNTVYLIFVKAERFFPYLLQLPHNI